MKVGVKTSFAGRVLVTLLAIITVLISVHLLFQHLNLNIYHELHGRVFEISNRVDFDDEASLPTWVSQFILLSIGLLSFLAAYLQTVKGSRIIWGIIGAIGVSLSIDEVAALHELLLQTVHLAVFSEARPTVSSNAWFVLLPFIVVIGLLLLVQAIKHIPRAVLMIMIVGSFIYMSGAIFIDVLTNASNANNFYEKGILVAVEESFEMIGSTIILYAVISYIESNYGSKIKTAFSRLKG